VSETAQVELRRGRVYAPASHTATAEEIARPFEGESTVPKEQSMASKQREREPPASPLRLATHEVSAALSRVPLTVTSAPPAAGPDVGVNPVMYRRKLNLKPKFESGLSSLSFKRSVPGGFSRGLIGSTCTALQ